MELTYEQLMAMPHHPGWADGRGRHEWFRFDAKVEEARMLRAEVTWNDDRDDLDKDRAEDFLFTEPQLLLESNKPGRPGYSPWETLDSVIIDITQEEAARIVASPPSDLLERYAEDWRVLTIRGDTSSQYRAALEALNGLKADDLRTVLQNVLHSVHYKHTDPDELRASVFDDLEGYGLLFVDKE